MLKIGVFANAVEFVASLVVGLMLCLGQVRGVISPPLESTEYRVYIFSRILIVARILTLHPQRDTMPTFRIWATVWRHGTPRRRPRAVLKPPRGDQVRRGEEGASLFRI